MDNISFSKMKESLVIFILFCVLLAIENVKLDVSYFNLLDGVNKFNEITKVLSNLKLKLQVKLNKQILFLKQIYLLYNYIDFILKENSTLK